MSTVLIAWELGGGLGHLMRLKPVVQEFTKRGCRVVAVVRDIVRARQVFNDQNVSLLTAPVASMPADGKIKVIRCYGHILHNCGFGNQETLAALLTAWKSLFELIQPDLLICDHSPAALLAARDGSMKRIRIGTGFCCPPPETSFRDLRPELSAENFRLDREESLLLQTVNSTLREVGLNRLDRLGDFYRDVDASILTTYRELDHYGDRTDGEYWGVWSQDGGVEPDWPHGKGKRIFAYLSPFSGFPSLLNKLESTGRPTIIYMKNLSPSLRQRLSSPTIRFVQEPVDLQQAGRYCDLAVLNGGHGATASFLLAGKPVLQIPRYLEQSMTAQAIVRMKAGLSAGTDDSVKIERMLERLLSEESFTDGARRFAKKYASYQGEDALNRFMNLCRDLLASDASTAPDAKGETELAS